MTSTAFMFSQSTSSRERIYTIETVKKKTSGTKTKEKRKKMKKKEGQKDKLTKKKEKRNHVGASISFKFSRVDKVA